MAKERGEPQVIYRGNDPETLVLLKKHCKFRVSRALSDDLNVGQEYVAIPYKFFNINAYDKLLVQKWKAGETPIRFIQFQGETEKYLITRIWKNKAVNITVEGSFPPQYFQ